MIKYLSVFVFVSSVLFGNELEGGGVDCNGCGYFEVAAEWLYFMPSFDQSEFVAKGSIPLTSISNSTIERYGEDQNFHSGLRVQLAYQFYNCINAFLVRYTHFKDTPDRFIRGSNSDISQILGLASNSFLVNADGTADFSREYRYNELDFLFSFCRWKCCRLQTTLSAGITLSDLKIKEEVIYIDTDLFPGVGTAFSRQVVDTNMCLKQIGPQVAFDFSFPFITCLNIISRADASLLSAWNRSKLSVLSLDTDSASGTDVIKNIPNFWHVNTQFGAKLGLQFVNNLQIPFFCSWMGFDIQGGYEWLLKTRAVDRIYMIGSTLTNAGFSFNEWSDFTLQGPYVKVNLSY